MAKKPTDQPASDEPVRTGMTDAPAPVPESPAKPAAGATADIPANHIVIVQVLINGTIINGGHRPAGATLKMTYAAAKILVGEKAVRIIGV